MTETNDDLQKDEGTSILPSITAARRSKKNQEILTFTCTAFFLFAMAEVVGALTSNSLSLLGDAGAMSIDVFTVRSRKPTPKLQFIIILSRICESLMNDSFLHLHNQYICNIYAERLKAGDTEISNRMRFTLEVFVPIISLCCLLIVTGYVTVEAIHVLYRPTNDHEEVNIYFLYGFSTANVLVDGLSSLMFFRKGDEDVFLSYRIQKRINSYSALSNNGDVEACSVNEDNNSNSSGKSDIIVSSGSKANLNMISAFTHLTGDSMRTSSVIIAALMSTILKIPSNTCDAWAAIVCTITISFMVIPLVWEIYKAISKRT